MHLRPDPLLRRVLRDRPQHVPMLMLLADLYNRNQQWGDAAETYSEVVRMSSSADALFNANNNLASILADHLGDLARARNCLEAALTIRSDDRVTLLKLTDIQARLGDGPAAAETARRLLRAATSTEERVASIIHLANIEQNLGHRAQALEALLSAVILEGPDGKAAHRYKGLLGDDDAAKRYEGGSYFIVYLSPRDYHRVHAPVEGRIRAMRYVPGTLYPVNAIGTEHAGYRVDDLEQQARAIFQRASVLILAAVPLRAQELAEKIAVRAMQFDAVKARLLATARRRDEVVAGLFDLRQRHGAGVGFGMS